MKMIQCLLLMLLACCASSAQAELLLIGHFAPRENALNIRINGQPVANNLQYLEVVRVEAPVGAFRVEINEVGSNRAVGTGVYDLFGTRLPLQPMLYIAGTGDGGATELYMEQGPQAVSGATQGNRALLNFINASSVDSGDDFSGAYGVQFSLQCDRSGTNGGSENLAQLAPISLGFSLGESNELRCDLQMGFTPVGAFEVFNVPLRSMETTRFIVVGNGADKPFQIVATVAEQVAAVANLKEVEPAPTIISDQFWFDRTRPGQGISLYELPGAGLVYGTWQTFAENGEPIWYVLDGVSRNLPGDRDLTIYSASITNGLQLIPVGTGRLTYFNCNLAEARFTLGSDVRLLRLERSVPVDQCFALD